MPTIEVRGMGCDGCEDILEQAIGEVTGVTAVDADHETGVVGYEGDADQVAVADAVAFAGYTLVDQGAEE